MTNELLQETKPTTDDRRHQHAHFTKMSLSIFDKPTVFKAERILSVVTEPVMLVGII
jgi:hypothetical protein